MFSKHSISIVLIGAALLFLLPLGSRALWDSDEGRYAAIAAEMRASDDWITPKLNRVAYLEKPPLVYWAVAAAQRLVGPNEFASRLPCAFYAWLTLCLTMRFGRQWRNQRTAVLAGTMLGTSLLFFGLSQFLVLDMALTFWTTLFLVSGARLLADEEAASPQTAVYLAALAAAGGLLTKGLVGLVLPLLALGVSAWWSRRLPALKAVPWWKAVLVAALLAAP